MMYTRFRIGSQTYPLMGMHIPALRDKFTAPAVNLTLEAENKSNCKGTSGTTYRVLYDLLSLRTQVPVLSVAKKHNGNFTQGQPGASYTVVVSNGASAGSTSGLVTVTDTLPSGLTLASMAGTGWNCSADTCTRSDVLNPGASYPPITVTVNVAAGAPSQVTNQTTVSGGGAVSPASAMDPTTIVPNPLPPPNVALNKAATQSSTLTGWGLSDASNALDGVTDGNFFNHSVSHTNFDANAWWQVDLGASATLDHITLWNRTDCCGDRLNDYWVFISNTPFLNSDTPATLQIRPGTWSTHQTTAPNPSTTIPATAVQGRYVRVQLSGTNALSLAEAQVFGGGTTTPSPVWSIAKTHAGSFTQGQTGAQYTVTVSNSGTGSSSGLVSLTDTVPPGLSLLSMAGSGWSCAPPTCTRSDTLAAGSSYAPLTVTVKVASNAPSQVTNQVAVSGGGAASPASASDPTTVIPSVVAVNVALNKPATQSSTVTGWGPADASQAVDGNTDGNFFEHSVSHTNSEPNGWWQVDLGTSATLDHIVIWNRRTAAPTA